MTDFYRKNIDILESRFPRIAEKLAVADDGHVESVDSKSGGAVPCVTSGDGRKLFVHSRIDPLREAERFICEVDINGRDLVVVLGFGYGYHVGELLKKAGGGVQVLAVEKDPLVFRKALESRDLSPVFLAENFSVSVDPPEDELASLLHGKSSRNVLFIMHRGSHQVYPGYYSNILSILKSYISTKDVNIATLARFEKTWSSNIARNIGTIAGSPGANIFYGAFAGMPAIVVAAGPSLTESLPFIKENAERALVIAVDTSYRILVNYGITPHFCVTVDAQLLNARYFEGTGETGTVLIADPMVHPSTFRFFKGRVAVTGLAFDMMKWIENIVGARGELTHGGSVSTNAYDFAKRLGASPVILVGQDLSYTGGLAHARGSYLDEQIHNKTMRFNNAQMFNRRQLTSLPKILLPGIKGNRVHSSQKMVIFLNWFEKRVDDGLINATPDGALIKGARNISHDEIKLGEPAGNMRGMIDGIMNAVCPEAASDKRLRLKKRIEGMESEVRGLIPVLERASFHAAELSRMIDEGRDKSDPGRVNYILGKLADTDRFVESREKSKDMISFSIQRVIHTITEGYDIDGRTDLNPAERSEYLYRGLRDGAVFNRKILGKMVRILSE